MHNEKRAQEQQQLLRKGARSKIRDTFQTIHCFLYVVRIHLACVKRVNLLGTPKNRNRNNCLSLRVTTMGSIDSGRAVFC